jgi:GTPase SAR1 family protein
VALETETVKFEIWDTAGQERYRSLAPMYYRGAQAAVVVFSLVDAESFNGAKAWVTELQKFGSSDVVIALAGESSCVCVLSCVCVSIDTCTVAVAGDVLSIHPLLDLDAGNKADLPGRQVNRDVAIEYARSMGCFYLETSAKTAAGVTDLFREVARRVPKTGALPRRGGEVDPAASSSSKCC